MASTAILESPATFESQAERASLSNPYILALKAHGISTLSKLAYAVTTPGVSPSDAQVTQFLQTIRPGVDPTISDSTAVKRLIFESQTLTIANLRATLQSSDDSGAKRIAPPERSARIAARRFDFLVWTCLDLLNLVSGCMTLSATCWIRANSSMWHQTGA